MIPTPKELMDKEEKDREDKFALLKVFLEKLTIPNLTSKGGDIEIRRSFDSEERTYLCDYFKKKGWTIHIKSRMEEDQRDRCVEIIKLIIEPSIQTTPRKSKKDKKSKSFADTMLSDSMFNGDPDG